MYALLQNLHLKLCSACMAWRFFIVLLGHWANYLYFLFVKAKVSAMFYRKWELIPTNKKILTYIAEKQRHWTQSISRGFSNETFAQNNKEKSTVLSTLQWFYQYLYLCISCLFQRGEDGKGSPSLHRYDPCLSWRLQQIRRWSIFIDIFENIFFYSDLYF